MRTDATMPKNGLGVILQSPALEQHECNVSTTPRPTDGLDLSLGRRPTTRVSEQRYATHLVVHGSTAVKSRDP